MDLKEVSKQEFWNYFKDKEYTTQQDICFHSDNFIVNGEVVGYMETSSWGTPAIYKLKYGTSNFKTISFVSDFIWAKENGKL